jgi:magnesium transporter
VILAFFIPMVMATGGNTGIQTSTIVIRRLVTQEFDTFRARRHILRELLVSLLIGAVLGGLMVLVLYLWQQDATVGLVIGLAMMMVVLMAATVGTTIPLVLHRLGIDPTVATGPFITTLNDVLGLATYFVLARWLLTTF